jgi:hypothetical protein
MKRRASIALLGGGGRRVPPAGFHRGLAESGH